jgi:hypothetical protein
MKQMLLVCVALCAFSALVSLASGAAKPKFNRSLATVFHDSVLACDRPNGSHPYSGFVVAHRSLPCGTRVRFCFKRCAWARVADRGPFTAAVWDLDSALASRIGFPYSVAYVHWRRAR